MSPPTSSSNVRQSASIIQQILDLESELDNLKQENLELKRENEELKMNTRRIGRQDEEKRQECTDFISRARESLTNYQELVKSMEHLLNTLFVSERDTTNVVSHGKADNHNLNSPLSPSEGPNGMLLSPNVPLFSTESSIEASNSLATKKMDHIATSQDSADSFSRLFEHFNQQRATVIRCSRDNVRPKRKEVEPVAVHAPVPRPHPSALDTVLQTDDSRSSTPEKIVDNQNAFNNSDFDRAHDQTHEQPKVSSDPDIRVIYHDKVAKNTSEPLSASQYKPPDIGGITFRGLPTDTTLSDVFEIISGGPIYRCSIANDERSKTGEKKAVFYFVHPSQEDAYRRAITRSGVCLNRYPETKIEVESALAPTQIPYEVYQQIQLEGLTRCVKVSGFHIKEDDPTKRVAKIKRFVVNECNNLIRREQHHFKLPPTTEAALIEKVYYNSDGTFSCYLQSLQWARMVSIAMNRYVRSDQTSVNQRQKTEYIKDPCDRALDDILWTRILV